MIDLHCHTTASDGSKTPKEFIAEAAKKGLHIVAITDHDTIEGVEEAMLEGEKYGIRVIPGIEFSAEDENNGNKHILGYHIDHHNPELLRVLKENKKSREDKIPKMIDALQAAGYKITLEEVLAKASGTIGRPHVAAVLVEKGYEPSIKVAIESGVLVNGGIADIKRKKLTAVECVELIAQSNGIPVLAHPYQTKLEKEDLESFVEELTLHGLQGIETHYSEHTPDMTAECKALAAKFNLIETGGSDWHGSIKPHIQLGTGRGTLVVPQQCVDDLDRLKEKELATELSI